ncbi:MAG: PKD domain-containing protein, partial [Bacteroidota bacterium]
VRQGATWYKDLSNGDPSWDYDFMIMPLRTFSINPAFSFNANNLSVAFSNTSTNGSTYAWDFGDGNSSASASPSHLYSASGTYQVELVVGGPAGSGCSDYVAQIVVLTNTSLQETAIGIAQPYFDPSSKILRFLSLDDQECFIFGVDGKIIEAFHVFRNEDVAHQIQVPSVGVYSMRSSLSTTPFRFVVH